MGVPAPSPPYFCAPKSRIAGLRAALFDLDGTLYDQSSLRAAILLKLSIYVVGHPLSAWQTLRILRSYRKAQEWMRYQDREFGDLAEAQLNHACQWSGADSPRVRQCIREWMEERPTQILMRYRMPFLVEFLEELKNRRFKTAVCSDYPAAAKLQALGILHCFDSVHSAQDAGTQRFKPHPRLLQTALQTLGVSAEEAVYFGDRPQVDGTAAARAGLTFIKISPRLGFKPFLGALAHE